MNLYFDDTRAYMYKEVARSFVTLGSSYAAGTTNPKPGFSQSALECHFLIMYAYM